MQQKISWNLIFWLEIYVLPSRPGEGDLHERKQPRKNPWMDPDLGLKKELVFMPITSDDDSLHYVLNWPPSNRWTIAASWRRPTLWWWRRSQRRPALSAVGESSPADYFDKMKIIYVWASKTMINDEGNLCASK